MWRHSHVKTHTGGHFGVQLNGDLVCCMMCMQNAVQTWQLMDLPHKYVQYCYPVHVICETWAHYLHSSRLSHTSSYLLVHQDSHHAQKYHRVMQTYIIFHHVMKCSVVHVETTLNYGQVWNFISLKPARPLNILTHSSALLAAIFSLCSLGITINCSVGITISCSLLAFPLSVSLTSMLPLLLSISNS